MFATAVAAQLRPPRYPTVETPRDYGLSYEPLHFTNNEGILLAGWWIGVECPIGTVIVGHGYGADKSNVLPLAVFLVPAGMNLLFVDFRAHGESGGETTTLGGREADDLRAAVDTALLRAPRVPVGILGISMGGAAALLLTEEDERVRAVATDSAYARLDELITAFTRLSFNLPDLLCRQAIEEFNRQTKLTAQTIRPEESAEKITPRPLLTIHGSRDELVSVESAYQIHNAAKEPKELWIVEGAPHVGSCAFAPAEYANRVTRFFQNVFTVQS